MYSLYFSSSLHDEFERQQGAKRRCIRGIFQLFAPHLVFAIPTTNTARFARCSSQNFRPIAIWGTDLILFYFVTYGAFGEEWTKWSWLELGGMVRLLAPKVENTLSMNAPRTKNILN